MPILRFRVRGLRFSDVDFGFWGLGFSGPDFKINSKRVFRARCLIFARIWIEFGRNLEQKCDFVKS